MAAAGRGGRMSQVALPALGMAMAGLLIRAAGGQAEAHFAVFGFLACTVVYRQTLPVLAGALAIVLHHLAVHVLQPWGGGPIGWAEPGLGKVIELAAYVAAQSGLLILLARRAREDVEASARITTLATEALRPDGTVDLGAARRHAADPVVRSLADLLGRMEVSIAQVRHSAESIGVAAAEIASGNADLSERTEQTTSSLQQTASSMEQLAGSVDQTAQSARTANQLATSASALAERSGEVVSQVVATMDEISASSRRIGDIIGTIDGIAFQTNILALNAAVEAARAGEQGRGFAVVAAEVRSLAQRAVAAAREIKVLIGSSVEQVESGSRLVTDAGRTMTELVASVQRVKDTIAQISAAAAEQSSGLGRIHQAVIQLDQATQQNAALVEQSAAAAESLQDQSRQLSTLVQAFHLPTDHAPEATLRPGPPPAAGRPAAALPASPRTAAAAAISNAGRVAAARRDASAADHGHWETF
jgi:methyl-accepting chemotaxis protein